tara:strand:- start:214 stop:1131 length:918 start_codon:yes stop_codon:yes gene_type:complete
MSKKTISINPDFFNLASISGKKKKAKKQKKQKSSSIIKPNLKKELINRIREHKKNTEIQKQQEKIDEEIKESNPENPIDEAIEHLNILHKKNRQRKEKKKRKKRNKTSKIKNIPNEPPQSIHLTPDPPYGNLKNGSKPTYNQWKKTVKNNKPLDDNDSIVKPIITIPKDPIISNTTIHTDSYDERQNKLSNLKIKFQDNNNDKPKKKRKNTIKTVKRRITLGKKGRIIGVLIKNRDKRKTIKKEVGNLKKKSIHNIKKYLKKHNLIKIGSTAPEDVLRNMYENSYLAGDVSNKNGDILLHNFIEN